MRRSPGAPRRRPGPSGAAAGGGGRRGARRVRPRPPAPARRRRRRSRARALADVEDGDAGLAADALDLPPRALVVHGHPAALFLAVVPVLVRLVEDLQPLALDDVQDLVVVVVLLVVVGDGPLPH